jgi:prepilin-type N-terminal cleavage/methylation domain-containing protein
MRNERRRGFSLVETAIVAVVLSIMVVSYFTLSRQETISARTLRDRAQAMALARNILCLVRYGHNRVWLENAGAPTEPGVFEYPVESIPQGEHAFGEALSQWADRVGATVSLRWLSEAPDGAGGTIDNVGKATCTITWTGAGGRELSVQLPAIVER